MTVLVDTEIRTLASDVSLIDPFDESSLQGASYDMRLGRQYVRHGSVVTLTEESPTLLIPPGEFILLTSMEVLKIPTSMIGHNGIMSNWAKRGLVSLFSPQIDPGFHGVLVVPVFNAGDVPISIQLGEKIFTVEFVRTKIEASYAWSDRNGQQRGINNLAIPIATRPNLSDISQVGRKLDRLERELQGAIGRLELFEARMKGEMGEGHAKLWGEVEVIKAKMETATNRKSLQISSRTLVIAVLTALLTFAAIAINVIVQNRQEHRAADGAEVSKPPVIKVDRSASGSQLPAKTDQSKRAAEAREGH